MARITSGVTCDIHGRWGMTHKQVVALFTHMDSVDIHRANTLRETGLQSKSRSRTLPSTTTANPLLASTSSILADHVDSTLRQKIIEKYVSYKRGLHLKRGVMIIPSPDPHGNNNNNNNVNINGNNGNNNGNNNFSSNNNNGNTTEQRPNSPEMHHMNLFTDDVSNIKLIKKFIQNNELNKELLERQLSHAGVAVEEDFGMGRKRKVAMRVFRRKPFLCLTDPNLGKPWKQIIEEVVREDIVRKKRILQEQNRKNFQERVNEEKKKGLPIPTFTSSNGRRGTELTAPLSMLASPIKGDEDIFSPIGFSTSSPTTPLSVVSLHPSSHRRSTRTEKSFFPNQPVSPTGESSQQSSTLHLPVL